MRLTRNHRANRQASIIAAVAGIAVGSAVAYCFRFGRKDAAQKRRRRELLRLAIHRSPLIEELAPIPPEIDDDLLFELVRSELRRCCSYPGALIVTCQGGVVHLEGPILKSELNRVLRSVARIPGVEEIRDHLEAHRHPWGFGNSPKGNGEPRPGEYFGVSSSEKGLDLGSF